jgi:ribosome-dependent ATPase
LEEAFIAYLKDAAGEAAAPVDSEVGATGSASPTTTKRPKRAGAFSLLRLFGYARREALEMRRDPVRLTFALLGTAVLMFVLSYGISMDVEDISFAVLDRDRTPQSRDYIQNIAGSRYFVERRPIVDDAELDVRMRNGELSLALEIPPRFGKDLKRGRTPAVGAWVDGAMPFRAETIRGYVQGMHAEYLSDLAIRARGLAPVAPAANVEVRYRYNQDFKSLYAMVPGMIPLLLVMVPAMLMALGVVREKELGSITNFYATPVTRLEFLLGKQLPYIGISMINFFGLIALALFMFDVPLKGSFLALTVGGLLYVTATTGLGLLISAFTQTQIAAIFGTAIITLLPAIQFSGLINPVSSLEGAAAIMGRLYPTTYFLTISRGTFTKALGFPDLYRDLLALAAFVPVLTVLSLALLKKQER